MTESHLTFSLLTGENPSTADFTNTTIVGLTAGGGPQDFVPGDSSGSRRWARLVTVDGQSNTVGGFAVFTLNGTGDYGTAARGMLFISAAERGGVFDVSAWGLGVAETSDPAEIYWVPTADPNTFEVWALLSDFNQTHSVQLLAGSSGAAVNADSFGTTAPPTPTQAAVVDIADGVTAVTGSFTGDGTTTVFPIPHGLGIAIGVPSVTLRNTTTNEVHPPGGPGYGWTDANTVTATFTTAPTNGHVYEWRAI